MHGTINIKKTGCVYKDIELLSFTLTPHMGLNLSDQLATFDGTTIRRAMWYIYEPKTEIFWTLNANTVNLRAKGYT